MSERKLTKVEVAATWFWHNEYADSGLSAVAFYRQLTASQKNLMCDMVEEIEKATP